MNETVRIMVDDARQEALAKNTESFGEAAAKLIDEVAGVAFRTRAAIELISVLPAPLWRAAIDQYADLVSQICELKGIVAGFSGEETLMYVQKAHDFADSLHSAVQKEFEATPSLVVPNHLH